MALTESGTNASDKKILTVVVPCYNEEACLEQLHAALAEVGDALEAQEACTLQMLLVDNGSADSTLQMIKGFAREDERVRYLSLSRNFTKEGAVYAGLSRAEGDYVAVMDADMQDSPAMLLDMVHRIQQGDCDRVGTYVKDRKGQSPIYAAFARLFYWLLMKMAGLDIKQGARDFSVMTKRYVDSVLECQERCRFSKGLFAYVGYNTVWLEVDVRDREAGQAKWSFFDRASYAIDSIVAFSTVPLHVITIFGMVVSGASILYLLFILIRELIDRTAGAGWPSLVCLITFLGGTILLAIGVLGQYLSKIYQEVKGRPAFIIVEESTDTKRP